MSFFYNNVGSLALERTEEEGVWKIDLSFFEKFSVRELYKPYGAILKLNSKDFISVNYCGKEYFKGDDGYEDAFKCFCSTWSLNTLNCHAVFSHLYISQGIYRKVTSSPVYEKLTDAEKEFLSITLHRVNIANRDMTVMIGEKGCLFHRITAFDEEGMMTFVNYNMERYKTIDIKKFILGEPGSAFYEKSKNFYSECERFVHKFFAAETDQLCMSLEEYVNFYFISTAYHEAIGDSQLNNVLKGYFDNRVYKDGRNVMTGEYVDVTCTIAFAIGVRTPKIYQEDYRSLLSGKRRHIWDEHVHNCLHTMPELDHDSWLKFRNFETSVGY